MGWFLRQTRKRVPPGLPLKLRADSGFSSHAVVEWCAEEGRTFTLAADQTAPLLAAITALPERRWSPLPEYAMSDVAELPSQPIGCSLFIRLRVNGQRGAWFEPTSETDFIRGA